MPDPTKDVSWIDLQLRGLAELQKGERSKNRRDLKIAVNTRWKEMRGAELCGELAGDSFVFNDDGDCLIGIVTAASKDGYIYQTCFRRNEPVEGFNYVFDAETLEVLGATVSLADFPSLRAALLHIIQMPEVQAYRTERDLFDNVVAVVQANDKNFQQKLAALRELLK